VVKEFWQSLGFLIKSENPETGVMETDWAENRAKIPYSPIRSLLGKVFDSAYSTGELDKFRTRLEHGSAPGTTEIYISHRGMVEVYTSKDESSTAWEPRPPDPGLEAEFLRRLMVRFGVHEARARAELAQGGEDVEHAKLVRAANSSGSLELDDPFDRAWRRVGLALDRVAFTVVDRDRSKGLYYVRYVDPQADSQSGSKDKGFLSKLEFWKSSKSEIKPQQYRILVQQAGKASEVRVLDKDGKQDNSDTGRRILSLLFGQLK
jgi:outer membrane protein assembly factor BamC